MCREFERLPRLLAHMFVVERLNEPAEAARWRPQSPFPHELWGAETAVDESRLRCEAWSQQGAQSVRDNSKRVGRKSWNVVRQ